MTTREHIIEPTLIHHEWDADLEPALAINSGDVVHYDLKVAGEGQVWPGATYPESKFDFDTIYNLSGPLFVNGAQAGDTLEIEILDLKPGDWGWAAFLPGLGLLPEDFPEGYVRTFDLTRGETTTLVPGVEIPVSPFLGVLGNHPGEPARQLPFPPHHGGGNMDNRHLTAGVTLWLPVFADGALFSCGDPHAAQGDGEVCVTAVECPMQTSLRFTLHKRRSEAPSFQVPPAAVSPKDSAGYHATMGIDPDLMTGAKKATRAMIDWLVDEHGLTREDAYILCSAAGDLKIFEIVDSGVWNVGMTMPLSIFQTR
ncbi:acetamidase/formamidase family protein [Actinacidiphila soli]|uniref:acetamidase/formamidase family protein n=1 Tax=Actinacidiphila soli TaxID=2487275 RepID=UPI000FCB3CB2|nr:acetamidase/formamidase family protein [Actinacidiphila soli]